MTQRLLQSFEKDSARICCQFYIYLVINFITFCLNNQHWNILDKFRLQSFLLPVDYNGLCQYRFILSLSTVINCFTHCEATELFFGNCVLAPVSWLGFFLICLCEVHCEPWNTKHSSNYYHFRILLPFVIFYRDYFEIWKSYQTKK